MRALVYRGPRQLALEDFPRPQPADGEVEIAVAAAGICGSDISGFLGLSRYRTPPLILGHEMVGRTREGWRVVVDPVMGCGACVECREGRKNLCSGLRLLGMDPLAGCFAEYVCVPATQVYEIPEELDDNRAVLAEPLANVVHLFRLAAVPATFRIGIVGAGTMGSLALKMALRMGATEVLVEDVDEMRLAAARRMGATLAVNSAAGRADGIDEAQKFAGGGLDLVLDASSAGETRQRALDLCRPGGTVVLLGMSKRRGEIDFGASIRKEHRVLTSFGYTGGDFRRSLDLLVAGEIDMTEWTAEMPLEDGQRVFEKMADARGETLKMVLRVS